MDNAPKATSRETGRIYLTHSLTSSKLLRADTINLPVKRSEALGVRFEAMYKRAWNFLFDVPLRPKLAAKYLGSESAVPVRTDYAKLGRIRCDYVLVQDDFHGLTTIDVHVLPECNQIDLVKGDEAKVWMLARLIRESHFGQIRDWLAALGSAEARLGLDTDALRADRSFTYVSICGQDPSVVKNWTEYALPIYRLLMGHADGADEDVAKEYLSERSWSSTEFFRNFHQPAALLSISRNYPAQYAESLKYFQPTLETITSMEDSTEFDGLLGDTQPEDRQYGLLPEYPPLRYLALPVGTYVRWTKAVMQSVQNQLLNIETSRNFLMFFVRAVRGTTRLRGTFYRTRVLTSLRLPVLRSYVDDLTEDLQLGSIADSIKELQGSMLNALLLVIALLTLVLTLLTIFGHYVTY